MDNNYDGPIFKKEENNNEVTNFFSQDQFASPSLDGNMNSFSANPTTMDIPPELDDIKNLSDAQKLSGPTLSALDPMNVMPDTNEEPKSKLDLYDNGIKFNTDTQDTGNINNEENKYNLNNNVNPWLNNVDNNISSYTSTNDTYGTNKEDYYNSNNDSLVNTSNENNNSSFFKNTYNVDNYINSTETDNSVEKKDNENNNNSNITFNSDVVSPIKENNMFNPNNSFNIDINTLPSLDSDDDYDKINTSSNLIQSNQNKIKGLDEIINTDYSSEESEKDEENDNKLGLDNIPDLNSFIISKKEDEKAETKEESEKEINDYNSLKNDDYNVVHDVDLSLPNISKIDTLDDIDNIKDDTDTLEIIDEEEAKEDNNESITKIKKLVTELKNQGELIELEEFDFENTYQLVIKVTKKGEKDEDRNS